MCLLSSTAFRHIRPTSRVARGHFRPPSPQKEPCKQVSLSTSSSTSKGQLGVELCLKLVVIVGEDVDIFDEAEVLWTISTRFQADKDLVKVQGAMGVVLDPSASDEGIATRIGMDATKPLKESAIKIQIPEKAKEFAKRLVSSKLA